MIIPGKSINGGVPKVFINSIKAMQAKGCKVTALIHKDSTGVIKSLSKIDNLDIVKKNFQIPTLNQDFGGLSLLKFIMTVLSIVFSGFKFYFSLPKYDIFLVHDIVGSVYMPFIKSAKKIVYLHSYRSFQSKKTRFLLQVLTTFFANTFISPTKDIANEMKKINKNIEIARIGTPLLSSEQMKKMIKLKSMPKGEEIKLVYVGRISPVKNLKDMIKFAAILKHKNIKFSLKLYGKPMNSDQQNYLNELKKFVKLKNLGNHISFMGYIEDVNLAYKGNDFSLIFSDGEAIPMAGLESFLNNVPVIGYNRPGINDLIGKNKRGIIFDYRDFNEGIQMLQKYKFKNFEFYDYLSKFTNEQWSEELFQKLIYK